MPKNQSFQLLFFGSAFAKSKGSLGSRQLMKKLDTEGFKVARNKVRKLIKLLNLRAIQRQKYRVIKRKVNRGLVADNVLNQQFNQKLANVVWAADISYLRTNQGCGYLAIVLDLYSRRIIGWHLSKQINGNTFRTCFAYGDSFAPTKSWVNFTYRSGFAIYQS